MRPPGCRKTCVIHIKKNLFALATGFILCLMSIQSMASDASMRCTTHRVFAGNGDDGSTMYEVLKKCGEPEAKRGNTWVYEQGNKSRFLTFNYEGKLVRIESERI